MRKALAPLIAAVLTAVFVVTMSACVGPVQNERELKSATDNVKSILQSKLLNLNNAVCRAADKIAVSGLDGDETRDILNGLCKKYSYLIDCSAADPQGKMIAVAPEEYRSYEGTETANTEASKEFFISLNENRQPILSHVFRAVEGVDAVVLVWPVVSEQSEVLGSVSALFKPEDLLGGTLSSAAKIRGMKVNVVQTDGLTIYCSSGKETGRNLFTDERYQSYPGLLAMGEKMVAQETGSAVYTFLSDATGQPVKKTACWTTIGLHGTEWRIVSMVELGD
ncbi:MAG: cache domain-containing protein [Dehalococcoidia bacterium]|nr:cache domain-containing protein [Dehalococcoidia bacterium]